MISGGSGVAFGRVGAGFWERFGCGLGGVSEIWDDFERFRGILETVGFFGDHCHDFGMHFVVLCCLFLLLAAFCSFLLLIAFGCFWLLFAAFWCSFCWFLIFSTGS